MIVGERNHMSNRFVFRVCYTAQDGSKTVHYSGDDDPFLIGLDGKVYDNYGESWKNPMWEELFDVAELPILQQSTGVVDKNGKTIFEGDIIKYRGREGTVEFFAGGFVCCWDDQTDDAIGYMMIDDMEIKGNSFKKV